MNETNLQELSPEEKEKFFNDMVDAAYKHLVDTYLATNHRRNVDIIDKAFNFARQAHKGVKRLSGEPYILHPLAVAQIACEEIGLGSTSICAALLHDVEEDTDFTYEDIANLFGTKIANIVEGVTKISGGVFGDNASLQAETIKKLLLTMSDDVRVILIKISDRLHNMRTLASMAPRKQYKIAGETLYIYAPLADRLGLNKIKSELENLSFKYEHPEEYERICRLLAETQPDRDAAFEEFTPPIRERLDAMGFKYTIKARIKTPYSIWTKMESKHIDFSEIYDILAIRIVFQPRKGASEVTEAFSLYGALVDLYTEHPQRRRNWLKTPKANGYRALHSTFMSKKGQWIEVQIRSERMDEMAEQGVAAHWKYKDPNAPREENELDKWLNSIKEILDDPQPDTLDFLDTIKLNLFASEILVFTPKGEIKSMPLGSTALDFAFSIHSMLGSHCIGAKVNRKLVPLDYRLRSGDQVEILTSTTQRVEQSWLGFVTTAKARSKVQAILRRENRAKQKQGEQQLNEALEAKGFTPSQPIVDRLTRYFGFKSPESLFLSIALGNTQLDADAVRYLKGKKRYKGWRRFVPFIHEKVDDKQVAPTSDGYFKDVKLKKTIVIDDDMLEHCHVSSCCKPLPGDDILGYVTPDDNMEIHQRSCPTATKYKAQHGDRIASVRWELHSRHLFRTKICVAGVDSAGMLYAIADLLHNLPEFPVHRIELNTDSGLFEGSIEMSVSSTDDVEEIRRRLRSIENVTDVHRHGLNEA